MDAKVLDGKWVANFLYEGITKKIKARARRQLRPPGLAVIQVGADPASKIYVRNKRLACEKLNFHSIDCDLPETISQTELEEIIRELNTNDQIDGIIVQTPLPPHLDPSRIIDLIRFDKDVDGFHPYNLGRLALRRPFLRPCTPYGIIKLLQHYKLPLAGVNAVIVGASNIVGRPMALELLLHKATVTVCHRFTQNLQHHVAGADLLIVAIGKPGVISSEWIKPGATVVDVGINRAANGKVCGDIDYTSASKKAAWITPVPGGVGPMTVAILLENTLLAAQHRSTSNHLGAPYGA